MTFNLKVVIIRIILGLAGGWLLTKFFLTDKRAGGVDWITVLVLAVIIFAAATASETWRNRK